MKLKLKKLTLRNLDERDRAKEELRLTASTTCLTCLPKNCWLGIVPEEKPGNATEVFHDLR
jgi:hypothetical protein